MKGYSVLGFILALIEKSKRATENGNVFREISVNLSMTFDYVPHDLATAKLNAYWFILKTILN